jgi:hypothetical protein
MFFSGLAGGGGGAILSLDFREEICIY